MIVSTSNLITPKNNMRYCNNWLSDNVCSTIVPLSEIYSIDGNTSINILKANVMLCLLDNTSPSGQKKREIFHKLDAEDPAVMAILGIGSDMDAGVN